LVQLDNLFLIKYGPWLFVVYFPAFAAWAPKALVNDAAFFVIVLYFNLAIRLLESTAPWTWNWTLFGLKIAVALGGLFGGFPILFPQQSTAVGWHLSGQVPI